jgi:hypothetical protein
MLASLTRTKTFWLVVVVMLGYGIITWDDDDAPRKPPPASGDVMVNMILEIGMSDFKRDSVDVAVAATLGSAGHLAEPKVKVWNGIKYPTRPWHHLFRVRRGEAVNAEVANPGLPVDLLICGFLQEGQGDDKLIAGHGGYGDITGPHLNGGPLARCAAVAR